MHAERALDTETHMMLAPILLALTALASTQDAPAHEPNATELARVLRDAAKPAGIHFTGSVSERTSDDGGGAIVMGVGGGGAKFAGEVDAWRTAKNELFVLSKKRLPELALFDDGVQSIVRTTCGDEAIDASQACTDLTALLDLGALAKAVDAMANVGGTPKVGRVGGAGEPRQFMCELPARFIKSAGGLAQMAMPKILRIEARFTLDEKGALASVRFAVVRSDPFGEIRRNALEGGGSSAVVVKPGDLRDDEGPSSVYEFRVDDQAQGKHAQAVLESLRESARSDAR